MGAAIFDRTAATDHPVMEVLAGRWSPRAYDATAPLDEQKLSSALEAARWAPSANNVQPWRFIVARRGTAEHAAIVETLVGFNQLWAGDAAALVVAIAEDEDADGNPRATASYDLGQAVAHLSVQAHHDGLHVHQMAGFDADALRARFEIEARFRPVTVVTLGDLGDPELLPDGLRERESAPRSRRPLSESVLTSA